jgi:hypothetical protein
MGVSGLDNNFAFRNVLGELYAALKFEVPTTKKQLQTLIKYLLGRAEIIFIGSILFQSNGDNAKALVYVNKALT